MHWDGLWLFFWWRRAMILAWISMAKVKETHYFLEKVTTLGFEAVIASCFIFFLGNRHCRNVEMNTGPSGVSLEQEATQAEIIPHRCEWRNTHSLAVWAHGNNRSSVYIPRHFTLWEWSSFLSFVPSGFLSLQQWKDFQGNIQSGRLPFIKVLTCVHTLFFFYILSTALP